MNNKNKNGTLNDTKPIDYDIIMYYIYIKVIKPTKTEHKIIYTKPIFYDIIMYFMIYPL